ncbi:MAG TPA: DinB family protein [Chitinophagaceae bacterium]
MDIGQEYIHTAVRRLKYYKELGERSFAQLQDEEFHFQPSSESNSIAVIIQHLSGNMLSRWTNFLTEDGEKSWRRRDDEFEVHDYSKEQLIETWDRGWECFLDTLEELRPSDLLRKIHIREEEMTAIDAINRQIAHYCYHIGQIVYVGRLIKNEDWQNLSIPKGGSQQYNQSDGVKDPAKRL